PQRHRSKAKGKRVAKPSAVVPGRTPKLTPKPRLCARPGEWQLAFSLVATHTPWGFRKIKERHEAWVAVARDILVPQDVVVSNGGRKETVRVDYRKGRVRAQN
ncbi:unnamed protein product, partial [Pylaiella littoralis]